MQVGHFICIRIWIKWILMYEALSLSVDLDLLFMRYILAYILTKIGTSTWIGYLWIVYQCDYWKW